MSNGKGIAVFALLIGLIGLGLGGYVFYDSVLSPMLGLSEEEATNEPSKVNQWYEEYFDYSFDGTSEEFVDPMAINVEINTTSTLYVLFNGYVRFPTDNSLFVHIRVDNNEVSQEMRVRAENVAVVERYPVTLQYFNSSVGPGTYNVSVWARVGSIPANLFDMSLYIQSKS